MTASMLDRARAWGASTDISAKSALVTIWGDSVLPLQDRLWLRDLFALAEPFGFSERLVRTSMFRLAAEGWVTAERVGRQSRYSLTPLARREFADADRRIYHRTRRPWGGQWTLVLTNTAITTADEREQFVNHLRWHGFAALGRGVLASPTATVEQVHEIISLIGPVHSPPVARAAFDQIADLCAHGLVEEMFELTTVEHRYQAFIERYAPQRVGEGDDLDPIEAFALRTMLIHDFRRVRLREPDLPDELLPSGWAGTQAHELAASMYRAVSLRAWETVGEILGEEPRDPAPDRFA